MRQQQQKWVFLLVLSLIWGSSFILMKKALLGVSAIQLGALRVLITGICLLVIGYAKIRKINRIQWKWVALSAFLGTFFPAFLYAFAIRHIDSSIASILNAITPFNALWIGAVVFGFHFKKAQVLGILIGLFGTVVLIVEGAQIHPSQNYLYALLPVCASIGYAFNVNIIKKHLQELDALSITAGNFAVIMVPAVVVLWQSGFVQEFQWTPEGQSALLYITILSVIGTGVAKILFNRLIQISSPIFSSSVTYLIPLVAVGWGVWDGEHLSWLQALAAVVIFIGVYLVNKKK
jgi:drug/metabolite transporter (DMT)-like permease